MKWIGERTTLLPLALTHTGQQPTRSSSPFPSFRRIILIAGGAATRPYLGEMLINPMTTSDQLPIAGVRVVQRDFPRDHRGYLLRLFDAETPASKTVFSLHQVNVTKTLGTGTVRGLHLQHGSKAESKVVTCLTGAIFDVVVDMRPLSPTFGNWFGIELAEDSGTSVIVPTGCAHGMQSLMPTAMVHYLHSAPYEPSMEAGISALDPTIGVEWPLPPTNLSHRDRSLPSLHAYVADLDHEM